MKNPKSKVDSPKIEVDLAVESDGVNQEEELNNEFNSHQDPVFCCRERSTRFLLSVSNTSLMESGQKDMATRLDSAQVQIRRNKTELTSGENKHC